MSNDPEQSKRRGWLKNGAAPGDFMTAPRCGAKTRRGTPCQCPAMRNRRRCKLHGGKSTGWTSEEGFWAIHDAHYKHGYYTKRAKHQRATHRKISAFLREVKPVLRALYPKPRPI